MSLISCACGYVELEGATCRKCGFKARQRADKDAPQCWSQMCERKQEIVTPLTGYCKECNEEKEKQ